MNATDYRVAEIKHDNTKRRWPRLRYIRLFVVLSCTVLLQVPTFSLPWLVRQARQSHYIMADMRGLGSGGMQELQRNRASMEDMRVHQRSDNGRLRRLRRRNAVNTMMPVSGFDRVTVHNGIVSRRWRCARPIHGQRDNAFGGTPRRAARNRN